eukprot:360470_1
MASVPGISRPRWYKKIETLRHTCVTSGFSKVTIYRDTALDTFDVENTEIRELQEYIKGMKCIPKNKFKMNENNKIQFFDKTYRILKLNCDESNQITNECHIIANVWNKSQQKSNENQFLPEDIIGLIVKYIFNRSVDCLIGKNEYNSNN